ncbi:hypothetical protein BUALT_Bualt02G0052400 [Buddleja alternifolia]|uniref:Uncharacterized protein n=1 Tax=Buddleja alternifolia TaxID=168488 RepID=A0AAV6Y4B4_9LAMI|nr:hypothetical protein BUALT_Bualt02G0052400 [Buddleja alternifolia]
MSVDASGMDLHHRDSHGASIGGLMRDEHASWLRCFRGEIRRTLFWNLRCTPFSIAWSVHGIWDEFTLGNGGDMEAVYKNSENGLLQFFKREMGFSPPRIFPRRISASEVLSLSLSLSLSIYLCISSKYLLE